MKSALLTVTNKSGFHMKLAVAFVQAMNQFESAVTITYQGREINGKSIMSVIAACMKQGAEISVRCDGPDEDAMLARAEALVRTGFGETI